MVNDSISSNLAAATNVSWTVTHAPAAGNDWVVTLAEDQVSSDISSVVAGGGGNVTCTRAWSEAADANFNGAQYYCNELPSGTTTITVTQSVSSHLIIDVKEIAGAGNLTLDQIATAGTAGPATGLITGTTPILGTGGDLAIGGCELASGNMTGMTVGSPTNGYTGQPSGITFTTQTTFMGLIAAYNRTVGTSGTDIGWSVSAVTDYDCGIAAYECGTGGTPTATATGGTPTATATATPTATAIGGTASATATVGSPTATATTGTPTATATSVAVVAATPAMTNVNRIGVNLGNQGQFGESDFTQNMLDNPGFEFGQECWGFVVGATHSSSQFTTTNDIGEASGFWNGGTASVRTGLSAGDTFTVGTYTSGTFTCASSCPVLATSDVVAVCQSGPLVGGSTGDLGNWALGSGVSGSTAQKYEGKSSLAFNVADGGNHTTSFTFDTAIYNGGVCTKDHLTPCTVANEATDCSSEGGVCLTTPYSGPWHPVVGAFEISFYALASNTSGGTIAVSLVRSGGTNISHTFNLTNDGAWHQYIYNFTGTDTAASAQNPMIFSANASNGSTATGATIYMDDAYLGRAESSPTSFRDEVVTTLKTLNPGSLRYMIPLTLDQNDANFEGPPGCTAGATNAGGCDFLKGPSTDATHAGPSSWGWYYSPQDMYALANAVGAVPWVSIPNTFSDADLQQFVKNACSAISSYGFASVWIEQSNEDWNGGGGGAKFGDAVRGPDDGIYGEIAGRNFSVMSAQAAASCPSVAARFHYIMGDQVCNNGVLYNALGGAAAAGYPLPNTSQYGTDDATYNAGGTNENGELPDYGGTLSGQAAQYAAWFAQMPPAVYFGGSNCIYSDTTLLGPNNFIGVYESGAGDVLPPGTTEQSYLSQGGFPSAMYMAEDWMLGTANRLPIQNAFTFNQIEFGEGGTNNPIWGITHDLDADFGPTFPHIRPIGLGMAVLNSAMAGSYYPVNTSAISNVYANAFQNNGHWSAALTNANNYNVQIRLQFPSSGTLPTSAQTVLYTNGFTDNNEDSNSVTIGLLPGGFTISGNILTLTLPPFSVVALLP